MTCKRHVQVGKLKALLDELIDRHAEAYMEAYPNDLKEFNRFEKSGTSGYYIGMVWTNDFEKPDVNQLKIMGSKSLTGNKMVEVNLRHINSLQSFFPGQIIAFLADPFVKPHLVARRMLDPMRIAPKLKDINTEEDIKLAIACGPFMKPDQEDWSLFEQMLQRAKEIGANRIVIIGPFVDLDNKLLCGQFEKSWKNVFDKLVEGLHDHPCDVYLVPSSRDVLHSGLSTNYFYPTPQFDFTCKLREGVILKCNIKPVSDPSQIDLGGIYMDVTSAEALLHLNQCTSFHNKEQASSGIFPTLYKHLISHGIYPIYPSPNDLAVDHVQINKYIHLDRLGPHILVVPSRFNQPVTHSEDRLIVPIHKCSVKKHIIVLDIPKIESSSEKPIKSVVIAGYTHKEISLGTKSEATVIKTEASETKSDINKVDLNLEQTKAENIEAKVEVDVAN